jgi:hypothetical protein
MSDDYQRIELIAGAARRRRWTTDQKLRIIEAILSKATQELTVSDTLPISPPQM